MRPHDGKLSFNKSWVFLQFKVYDMDFNTMQYIITEIENTCHSDIPFGDIDTSKTYFTVDMHSNRTKGCTLLKIPITKEQYDKLVEYCPDKEFDKEVKKNWESAKVQTKQAETPVESTSRQTENPVEVNYPNLKEGASEKLCSS